MTGRRVSELQNRPVSIRILEASRQCVELGKPLVVTAESLSSQKNHLSVTVLYVPMSTDGITVDRLFLHNQIKSKFPVHTEE